MIHALLTLLIAAAGTPAPAGGEIELALADLTIRQRLIVRIPVPRRTPDPPTATWRERKGPRCVQLDAIAGAAITAPDSVDMILRGGARIRALLESACPALDFYSGFYLVPSGDGRICADRDSIHARSGGECQIDRFRKLAPPRQR